MKERNLGSLFTRKRDPIEKGRNQQNEKEGGILKEDMFAYILGSRVRRGEESAGGKLILRRKRDSNSRVLIYLEEGVPWLEKNLERKGVGYEGEGVPPYLEGKHDHKGKVSSGASIGGSLLPPSILILRGISS